MTEQERYENMVDEIIDLKNEIKDLQAENERLKNILICFMGALGKVRNIDDIESISQIPIMTELNKGIRAEIKAEAYKECIEKVKEIAFKTLLVINDKKMKESMTYYVAEYKLDNLLKELEGDK